MLYACVLILHQSHLYHLICVFVVTKLAPVIHSHVGLNLTHLFCLQLSFSLLFQKQVTRINPKLTD